MSDSYKDFGAALRTVRLRHGMSIGAMAYACGVHLPFMSDVERGVRPPLSAERINTLAERFGEDLTHLHRLAARCRGEFDLPKPVDDHRADLVAQIASRWNQISEREAHSMIAALTATRAQEACQSAAA